MKYFLFSSNDILSFEECVEDNNFWGSKDKNAFKLLDIHKGDKVIFYCSEKKRFIADCLVYEQPRPIEEYEDLINSVWNTKECKVPVVIRLKKIRDLDRQLDYTNWKMLNTFEHLKDRKSVSASLQSKSLREIDLNDYNFITN